MGPLVRWLGALILTVDVLSKVKNHPNTLCLEAESAMATGMLLRFEPTVFGLTARRRRKDREALKFYSHRYGVGRVPIRHQRSNRTRNQKPGHLNARG